MMLRVLLIGDDPDLLLVLHEAGMENFTFLPNMSRGERSYHQIDLIICDFSPTLDLTQFERTYEPILFLIEAHQQSEILTILDRPQRQFVVKPLVPALVKRVVHHQIAHYLVATYVSGYFRQLYGSLTPITGYADLLMMGAFEELTDAQKNAVEVIKDNALTMEYTLNEYRAIHLLFHIPNQLTLLNLSDVVESFLKRRFNDAYRLKVDSFSSDISGTIPTVYSEIHFLDWLLRWALNDITRYMVYSESEALTVTITAKQVEETEVQLEFSYSHSPHWIEDGDLFRYLWYVYRCNVYRGEQSLRLIFTTSQVP